MNELEKGICRLSLINIRKEPSFETNICSQILFGEHYSVLDKKKGWLYIELFSDKEKGWIQVDQHDSISNEYFEQINNSDYKICTDITGNIYFKKKNVNILLGSILPISTNELFKIEEQVAFNGESKSLHQQRETEFFCEVVKKYINAPYHPGGRSPFGIDEGGLIQQAFKITGYFLKRNLRDQATEGSEIDSQNDIIIGDVIFTGKNYPENAWICIASSKYVGIKSGAVTTIENLDLEPEIFSIRRYLHD